MQSEVKTLAAEGIVAEQMQMPDTSTFGYQLRIGGDFKVQFLDQVLEVSIPKESSEEWIASEELSLKTYLELPDGGKLFLLVEKDLACTIERENEDESDAFPNPHSD